MKAKDDCLNNSKAKYTLIHSHIHDHNFFLAARQPISEMPHMF